VRDSLETLLNLDNRVVRTLRALFVPGKLTDAWLKGQRVRYYSPFRLFFVSGLLCFAILNLLPQGQDTQPVFQVVGLSPQQCQQEALVHDYLDSLRRQAAQQGYNHPAQCIDSLLAQLTSLCTDSINLDFSGLPASIQVGDLFTMPPKKLIEHYPPSSWYGQVLLVFLAKSIQSSQHIQRYLLGHFLWFLILLIPLWAALSHLWFRKSGQPYVLHLILLLHLGAFAFVSLSIGMLFDWAFQSSLFSTITQLFIWPIYTFVTFKRCLGGSYWSVFWRWMLFGFSAFLIFGIGVAFYALLTIWMA